MAVFNLTISAVMRLTWQCWGIRSTWGRCLRPGWSTWAPRRSGWLGHAWSLRTSRLSTPWWQSKMKQSNLLMKLKYNSLTYSPCVLLMNPSKCVKPMSQWWYHKLNYYLLYILWIRKYSICFYVHWLYDKFSTAHWESVQLISNCGQLLQKLFLLVNGGHLQHVQF